MLHKMIPQSPKTSVIPRVYVVCSEDARMAWRPCILSAETFFSDNNCSAHAEKYGLDH